jgi:hypothetical protein
LPTTDEYSAASDVEVESQAIVGSIEPESAVDRSSVLSLSAGFRRPGSPSLLLVASLFGVAGALEIRDEFVYSRDCGARD